MTKNRSAGVRVALIFILIFSLILGFASLGVRSVRADEVNYKKKIVSVLFDNSGSMGNDNQHKTELAKYSLELLAGLLDAKDELYITPMNQNSNVAYYTVDLAATDRYSEIQTKIVDNGDLLPYGGTPPQSVARALSVLRDRGLQSSGDSYDETRNIDYWLVMLTDGAFDSIQSTDVVIEDNIKQYIGLNTIYLSFGAGSTNLMSSYLNQNYPFSAYYVPDATQLIKSMQDVANKISGRYGAGDDLYSVSDKEIIVDLDKFKFAVNNIAVIAQDCGAILTGVEYKGKNVSIKQKSVLKGSMREAGGALIQLVQDGYIAVVADDEYMSEGQVKFTFDREVGTDISVLVEPAIYIDAYLEREKDGGWEKTDVQQINSEMRPGELVRVQYKVYNSATDEELDLEEIFGTPTEKVTYCGKGYAVGEPMPLEKGSNAISVTIGLLNGTYTMYASIICYIEENPTYYRLEGDLSLGEDGRQITGVYRLFYNNVQVDRAGLSAYKVETEVTCPDGSVQALSIGSTDADGAMHVSFTAPASAYGEYTITAKATDNVTKLSRSNTQTIPILPKVLTITCLSSESFSTTVYLLGSNSFKVEFSAEMDGVAASFDDSILNYKLLIGDTDVTEKCTVDNGKLVFWISKDSIPDLSAGTKTLTLEANVLNGTFGSASYAFEIRESSYRVETLEGDSRELDIYDIGHTQAAVCFRIYKDDVPISVEEINEAMESGEISVETNPFGWITLLPCRVNISVEEKDGAAFVACRVEQSMGQPFAYWFASFIFATEKEISLTYNGISSAGTISIHTLSAGERVWRLATLLFTILFLLHVILFIIGFFVAKHLTCGTMLRCTVPSREAAEYTMVTFDTRAINMKKLDIILWHLSRFIPFREFAHQRPKENVLGLKMRIGKRSKKTEFLLKQDSNVSEYDYTGLENDDAQTDVKRMIALCERGERVGSQPDIDKQSFESLFMPSGSKQLANKGTIAKVRAAWCEIAEASEDEFAEEDGEKVIYHFIAFNRRKKKKR